MGVGVASESMTRAQILGDGLRAALLVAAGSALIGVPFLMGLDAAPLVTGVLVGSTAIALALIVSAGTFALAGKAEAMGLFAAAGLAALTITSVTRYSAGTA
jgi:hypothetical protein